MSKFGRYQAPESPSALLRLHFHDGTAKLKEADHEPKLSVLDQEDLLEQGIRCSEFIQGAQDADALGSCTANATTVALSNLLELPQWNEFVYGTRYPRLPEGLTSPYADTVGAEKAAIRFYHGCTDQTADTATEWPPTDCGSSGPYVYQYALSQGLIRTEAIAQGAENIVSLMQTDGVLVGLPFLATWMDPPSNGVVDGDGSIQTLEANLQEGVAGGHEIYFSAVEKLTLDHAGRVIPQLTVVRFRNSWTKSWGDNGSGRFHLSTILALGSHVDVRQFQV